MNCIVLGKFLFSPGDNTNYCKSFLDACKFDCNFKTTPLKKAPHTLAPSVCRLNRKLWFSRASALGVYGSLWRATNSVCCQIGVVSKVWYSCLCCSWSISQPQRQKRNKNNGNCPLQPLSAMFIQCSIICNIFDGFFCASSILGGFCCFLLFLFPVLVSIRPIHSTTHIQQSAVEIVEDCTGALLGWLKTLLHSQIHMEMDTIMVP